MSSSSGTDPALWSTVTSLITGGVLTEVIKRIFNGLSGRTGRQRASAIQAIIDHDRELEAQMEFREAAARMRVIADKHRIVLPAGPTPRPLDARRVREGLQKALNMEDERYERLRWQRHSHEIRVRLLSGGVPVDELPEMPEAPQHWSQGASEGDAS